MASLDAARDSIDLANAYLGHDLIPEQELVLEAGLGEDPGGGWAASTVCHFGGRQGAGKNQTLIARELAGLLLFGERLILHTAHEFKTANESFLRMVTLFENRDDLRRLVARIRWANGEQGIEFLSGQRLKFLPRTGSAGRGFAGVDLLVLDEAQHLQPEHLAASAPTLLANPKAQAWVMGSGGLSTSAVAWRWRRQGLEGKGDRFAYVEYTAEDVELVGTQIVSSRPDPLDREAWAKALPGYGRFVGPDSVLQLYDLLGPELFAREVLCVWEPEPFSGSGVIPMVDWLACEDIRSKPLEPLSFAVDVAPDRASASIGVAGLRADGRVHVEVLETRPGVTWVVDRLAAVLRKAGSSTVTLTPGGPAGSLTNELGLAGIEVVPCSSQESTQACGAFFDGIMERRYLHIGQPFLTAAVDGAERRKAGDSWVWDRRSSSNDITPLVAVTLASWALMGHRPEPERRVFASWQ